MSKSELTLNAYLARAATIDRTRPLWDLTLGFLRERGVVRANYHHFGQGAPNPHGLPSFTIAADGFPDDWVRHYLAAGLWRADPITRRAAKGDAPFYWRDVIGAGAARPDEVPFIAAAREADLGEGLAFHLAGPALRTGYAGLGFGRIRPRLGPAAVAELQAAVQMAHLAYCRVIEGRSACRSDLSPRERDVLRWIARGKSNGVIADILGISRHTVDTLVGRIFAKLDVSDRTTAAVKGLGLGLLPLPIAA